MGAWGGGGQEQRSAGQGRAKGRLIRKKIVNGILQKYFSVSYAPVLSISTGQGGAS